VPVAGLAVNGSGVLVGGDCLLEPPDLGQGHPQVVQGCALAVPVASLAEDGGCGLAGGDGPFESPDLDQGQAEVA
jgi:hypothetical protein